jgi:hypothetical protein
MLTLKEERMSAFSLLVPSFTPGVDPGGELPPQRQAAAWVYAGIWAVLPVETVPFTVVAMVLETWTASRATAETVQVSRAAEATVWPA